MTPAEAIQRIEAAGGVLALEGEEIYYELPTSAAPLLGDLHQHRTAVVELLRSRHRVPVMPQGVRVTRWEPKTPPVVLTRWSVVLDTYGFIASTLVELEAALAAKIWLAGNWSVRELVDRLEQVGVSVEVETGRSEEEWHLERPSLGEIRCHNPRDRGNVTRNKSRYQRVSRARQDYDKPVSQGRHGYQCSICTHARREEIDLAFVNWTSPTRIAREFRVSRDSIYRHAHALSLFEKRRRNVRTALEKIIEKAGEVAVGAAAVVSAVTVYAKINASGQWVERNEQVSLNQLFERMTREEMEAYAKDGQLPPWFEHAVGATAPDSHDE